MDSLINNKQKDYIPTPYLEYATSNQVEKEKSRKNNKNKKNRSELERSFYDLKEKQQLVIPSLSY